MALFFDSFWRAVAYCTRPRMVLLSLLPLLVLLLLSGLLGWLYWHAAVDALVNWLGGSRIFTFMWGWVGRLGVGDPAPLVASVLLVLLATPAVAVLSLLLVTFLTTPATLRLVASRRFPKLERRGANSYAGSMLWAGWSTLLALVALLLSLPLWFVPPLILIVPPLIWGWLTYRVLSYDVLNLHATADEREALMRLHRPTLLVMGVVSGYLSAAPAVVWASAVLFAVAFVVLVPIAIWIYTVVFVFSSLWFAHYLLGALQALRMQPGAFPRPAPESTPKPAIELPHEP